MKTFVKICFVAVIMFYFAFPDIIPMPENPVNGFCTGTLCRQLSYADCTHENPLYFFPNVIPAAYYDPAGKIPSALLRSIRLKEMPEMTGYTAGRTDKASSPDDYTAPISKVNVRINAPSVLNMFTEDCISSQNSKPAICAEGG